MQDQSPPTTGAAERAETSTPTPASHGSGISPSAVVATGHDERANAHGNTFDDRSVDVHWCLDAAFAPIALERLVEIDDHDDPGLSRNAGDGYDADPDCGRHVVIQGGEQPDAAGSGEGLGGEEEHGLHPAARR